MKGKSQHNSVNAALEVSKLPHEAVENDGLSSEGPRVGSLVPSVSRHGELRRRQESVINSDHWHACRSPFGVCGSRSAHMLFVPSNHNHGPNKRYKSSSLRCSATAVPSRLHSDPSCWPSSLI